jgi:S1-C subfamily serine protease
VRAENGWVGWVDGRRLIAVPAAPAAPAATEQWAAPVPVPVAAVAGEVVEAPRWSAPADVESDASADATTTGSSGPDADASAIPPELPPAGARRDLRAPVLVGVVALLAVMVGALVVAGVIPPKSSPASSQTPAAAATSSSVAVVATPAPTAAATVVAVDPQAAALQDLMVSVIKRVSPSVVEIQTDSGLGSGVIYDAGGDIVTNAHVVGTATTFQVTLSNGHTYTGTLVGTYVPDDIAVIKISATGLSPATFGDSSGLSVGDFVLAMGNPLGLQSSVTEGIVSALSRQVSEPTGNALPDVIQTSAAINPGNSGGALVDLNGNVVGIPTLAATDPQLGGSAPGIGFAISSNRAKVVADQLIAGGKVTNSGRAYLGVQIQDSLTNGALVISVVAGGPADKAGIVAGDTITALDALQIPDSATLIENTAAHHPGDVVKITLTHQNGTTATVTVTLGTLPS